MSMLAFFSVRPLNPANFAAISLLKSRLSLFVFPSILSKIVERNARKEISLDSLLI